VNDFQNMPKSLDLAETFAYAEPNSLTAAAAQHQTSSDATQQTLAAGPLQEGAPHVKVRSRRLLPSGTASQRPTRRAAVRAAATFTSSRGGDGGANTSDAGSDGESDAEMCGVGGSSGNSTDSEGEDGAAHGGGGSSAAQSHRPKHGRKKRGSHTLQRKPYDTLIDPSLPADEVRRLRRVLSNRESARRSRKRKAAQIITLEDELLEARAHSAKLEDDLEEAKHSVQVLDAERQRLAAEVARLQGLMAGVHHSMGAGMPLPLVSDTPPRID